jgi:membrane protein DedA with SNARE-associated domain
VEQFILWLGYPGITLSLFAENVFPPTPSESIMLFSGFLVGRGALSYVGVVLASTIGTLAGALLVYWLGTRLNDTLMRELFGRYGRFLLLSVRDYDRARQVFNRYGVWIILISRALPVVRAFIALLAGMDRMPLRTFLPVMTLGALGYNALYIYLGMRLGENWQAVLRLLDLYGDITWILLGGGLLVFVYWRLIRPRLLANSQADA